jgi:hypothetical protein
MLLIENGRKEFYQWDINQRLIVEDEVITEVHFSNTPIETALICEVFEENGKRLVNVPNILLQKDWDIKVYGCCGECVRKFAEYKVIRRKKPDDYVYTETEVKTWDDIIARVNAIEEKGISQETIDKSIEQYFIDNPVETGATAEQAEQIETNTTNILSLLEAVEDLEESGSSGIYVGPEAPTNENVEVWINPDKEPVEVYSKAEVDKAIKGGSYELIETITVEEGVAAISRTQEPDGTPYNFKRLTLKTACPKYTASNVNASVRINKDFGTYIMNMITTSERYGWCEVEIISGYLRATSFSQSSIYAVNTLQVQGLNDINRYRTEAINSLLLQVNGTGNVLPSGSTIEIWGVRA